MRKYTLQRALLLCLCSLTLVATLWAEILEDSAYERLWFGDVHYEDQPKMKVTVEVPEDVSALSPAPLRLELLPSISFQGIMVIMRVKSEQGEEMQITQTTLDLHRGRNEVTFQWDATSLAPGAYTLLFEIDYADDLPSAWCYVDFVRVSATGWRRDLDEFRSKLPDLERSVDAMAEELARDAGIGDSALFVPYCRLRLTVMRNALDTGEAAWARGDWALVERNVRYLRHALDALRSEITFGRVSPELLAQREVLSGESQELREGGVYVRNAPVFLFGLSASPADAWDTISLPERIKWLRSIYLNFLVLPVGIGLDVEAFEQQIQMVDAAVADNGIVWALQLRQEQVGDLAMDTWPELMESNFIDMAHAPYQAYYVARVRELIGVAGRNARMLVGASIARNPQFQYDGEEIRLQFVERIRERYPDRIDLNRLWRSHLADYDEITIWGDHPEHSYQNQRAYQYEWQNYHRELITLFLSEVKQGLAEVAPGVPIMVTLPESAFAPGETRHSPSREAMAALMDMNGCSVSHESGDRLYAMNYPIPHAYHTLMRSYASQKSVLNLEADINVTPLDYVEQRGALVRSAVWEAVMTGVTGMALRSDSSVFEYPEAVEAFAECALDVNRLGRVVAAFQQAQPEIAILFSEASKIMDDGIPHLESARFAFEGGSFAGFTLRYVTERQVEGGALDTIRVLILPDTMAVSDATFERLSEYVEGGGMVARVGKPIPYNERGHSRGDVIRATSNTVLVRGMNLPTEYLHAMDAALVGGVLPEIARPINAFGYPIEGVRSRYVEIEGQPYLYIINLRNTPINVFLAGTARSGRELIQGRDVAFPRLLPPLEPMLIRLDKQTVDVTDTRRK